MRKLRALLRFLRPVCELAALIGAASVVGLPVAALAGVNAWWAPVCGALVLAVLE